MNLKKITVFGWILCTSLGWAQNKMKNPEDFITDKSLRNHLKILASDEFQGRKHVTEGEEKTTAYLAKVYKELGLKAPYNGSYFQKVPMVSMQYQPSKNISLSTKKGNLNLEYIKDYIATTSHIKEKVSIKDSELVFAGYGIVAPEYGWNDYEGLDVKGKTVLVLVNDPGFATQNPKLFKGNSMTYYGRWPYKFEEAARQGAKGVWVIHETKAAGYGWQVLTNTAHSGLYIQNKDGNAANTALTGWITEDAVKKIFEANDLNFDNAKKQASEKGFKSIPLQTQLNIVIENKIKYDNTKNVVGIIEGTDKKDESIVFSAHWDHFGIGPKQGKDSIYNGAIDNGTAIAAMLETAKAFKQSSKPRRTLVFIAVSAEETGMAGSKYYAENALFPANKTIANLNYELLLPYGRMKDVTITGFGQSELDQLAGEEAEKQNRYIVEEPFPEQGMYYRSDHFSFAKVGIPSLFVKGWQDSRTHGKEWAKQKINEYWATKYHKPADNYEENFDLSGCVEDAQLFYKIGWRLATENIYPKWNPASEFKKIREDSLAK